MANRHLKVSYPESYQTTASKFIFLFFILFLLVVSCQREKKLSKEEAIDCLKILNSDLVNLANNALEKPEMEALQFLLKQKSAPIPYKNDSATNIFNRKEYNFQENTGIYSWSPALQAFEKTQDTSIILIYFPSEGSPINNAEFLISTFETQKTNSRPDFPVRIRAFLSLDLQNVLDRKNVYTEDYDPETRSLKYLYSLPLIPVFNFKVDF